METVFRFAVPTIAGAPREHGLRRAFAEMEARFATLRVRRPFQPGTAQPFPVVAVAGIFVNRHGERGLRRGRDRIRAATIRVRGVRAEPRIDHVDRVVHREMHHRRGANTLQREEAVVGLAVDEQTQVPLHDQRRIIGRCVPEHAAGQQKNQANGESVERFHARKPASKAAR